MSIKNYPNFPKDQPGTIVHPHHRDMDPITILGPGTANGLEVLTDEGYQKIKIPEGCVLVNTGDMLCNLTAGLLRGADHRVVKTEDWPTNQKVGRLQVALFSFFPPDQ